MGRSELLRGKLVLLHRIISGRRSNLCHHAQARVAANRCTQINTDSQAQPGTRASVTHSEAGAQSRSCVITTQRWVRHAVQHSSMRTNDRYTKHSGKLTTHTQAPLRQNKRRQQAANSSPWQSFKHHDTAIAFLNNPSRKPAYTDVPPPTCIPVMNDK